MMYEPDRMRPKRGDGRYAAPLFKSNNLTFQPPATVDGIGCIVDHLPRILKYAPSVPGGRSSLADRAMDLAFREIIDFLVAVANYFSRRSKHSFSIIFVQFQS